MDKNGLFSALDEYYLKRRAQLLNAIQTNRDQLYTFTIDLSAAVLRTSKTYRIDKPFKSISFEDSTSSDSYVFVEFDAPGEGKSFKKFKQNSGLVCDTLFNGCTIYFPAQSGTISCTIYYDCEYRSGSLINQGSISVTPSTAMSVPAEITANAAGSTFIPANSNAEKVLIFNKDAANEVKIGGSGVTNNGGTTDGLSLPAGTDRIFDCSGAIYVCAGAGLTAKIGYIYLT